MINYKQAKKILKSSKIIIQNETIKSSDSLNRVAGENILSKSNNPAANNAAFDGYAIYSKNTNNLSKKKREII